MPWWGRHPACAGQLALSGSISSDPQVSRRMLLNIASDLAVCLLLFTTSHSAETATAQCGVTAAAEVYSMLVHVCCGIVCSISSWWCHSLFFAASVPCGAMPGSRARVIVGPSPLKAEQLHRWQVKALQAAAFITGLLMSDHLSLLNCTLMLAFPVCHMSAQ